MKRTIYGLLGFLALGLLISSCGGNTFAKRLKDERKLIRNFIGDNNINVIYEYPDDSIFKENEYLFDSRTGVYFNVVKPGTGPKAILRSEAQGISGSTVQLRYDSLYSLKGDSISVVYSTERPIAGGSTPVKFVYGLPTTYRQEDAISYYGMAPACVVPLQYVREGAVLKIIAPFEQGSNYGLDNYEPMFYTRVEYSKISKN